MAPALKLPGVWNRFMGFYLGISIIVILSIHAVDVTAAAIGQNCTDNANCTGSNQMCNTDSTPGKCACSTGFVQDNNDCKIAHEGNCNSATNECASNLTCTDDTCVCEAAHYWNRTSCEQKIAYGGTCNVTGECQSIFKCIGSKCVCESTQYLNGNTCDPKIAYGGTCNNVTGECESNFKCIGSKCVCESTQYLNGNTCDPKIAYGGTCSNVTGECESPFKCIGSKCVCESTQYLNGNTCDTKIAYGGTCSNVTGECESPFKCIGSKCVCESTQYLNGNTCDTKIAYGGTCSNVTGECESPFKCIGSKCVCESTQYLNGNTCDTKIAYGGTCNNVTGECESNFKCIGSKCVCESTQYLNGNTCDTKIAYGGTCNNVTGECESNFKCIGSKCVCESTQYLNGNTCDPKIAYGGTCNNVAGECESNFKCIGSKCVCESTQYLNGNTCDPKIAYGGTCNNVAGECESNFKCIGSKCVCESTQYLNGNTCDPKIAYGGTCNNVAGECESNFKCIGSKCVCESTQYLNGNTCDTKIAYGGTCNNVAGECESNFKCIGSKCVCESTQYLNGNTCDTKIAYGGTCNNVAGECESNFKCIGSKCVCESTQYLNGNTCDTKIIHGGTCLNVTDECASNLKCTGGKCLCETTQYWNVNTCEKMTDLDFQNIQNNKATTSVTFTWTADDHGLPVQYEIRWENNGSQKGTNVTSPFTASPLTPGKEYTFIFVAYLSKDVDYNKRETYKTTSVSTIPAQPGRIDVTASHLSLNPMTIEFEASEGVVDRYVVFVSSGGTSQTNTTSTNQTYFTLVNGADYSYEITAYNANNDASINQTGNFKTDPAPSSPVKNLTIDSITSNSATVSWTLPDRPNGDITAFIIQVLDGTTCIKFYNLKCSNCTNVTMTEIPACKSREDVPFFTTDQVEANSNHEFSHAVTSLTPYKIYTIKIYAMNEKGNGKPSIPDFTTLEGRANNIKIIKVYPLRDDTSLQVFLEVVLEPGDQTGKTNFTVTLTDSESQSVVSTKHLIGYSSTNVSFLNLKAYHSYRVAAFAETEVGTSPDTTQSEVVRTLVSKPGTARNVMVHPDDTVATEFTLTLDCPPKEDRNGLIQKVIIRKEMTSKASSKEDFPFEIGSECKKTIQSEELGAFTVSNNYSLSAIMENQEYKSDPSEDVFFHAAPKPPIFKPDKKLVTVPTDNSLSENIIQLTLCVECLTDSSQGEIRMVGLIVCVKSKGIPCDEAGRAKRSVKTIDQWDSYATWAQSEDGGFKMPYRATPDDWFLENNPSQIYAVGGNTNCAKGSNVNAYCNGPLPSGRSVVVTIFSCTDGGCTQSESYISKTKASDDGTDAGLIAGIVVGIVAILVVAVIVIVFLMWRRRKPKGMEPISIQECSPRESRPIPIRQFKETLAKYHKDANLLFQGEFEDIRTLSSQAKTITNEALKEDNRVKNRYVDILPYDHSRVKLQVQADNDDTSDYINANYIPGFNSPREYIATQGPMHATIPHFWRMVWEQKSTVIVMLSDLSENNKLKVSLYWPENLNEPINYGEVLVEMTNFSQLNKYIIRNFRISFGKQTRRITHFFIPGWWDFSANLTFDDVLEFAQLVRKEATPPNSGPVVVHCSAGVGRTGTFIALDYFMQYIDTHGLDAELDIFNYVMSMRKNRPRMVQAEPQYIFIFDALMEVIERKLKAEQESLYDNSKGGPVYANEGVSEENIYVNTANGAQDHTYSNQAFVGDYENLEMKPTTVL